ncbi:hypothetical protein AAHA92_01253 [Salvia divinorum]|uniref:Uncharacterized protein n=1 Tax=Salvia divinorum TaxID=28513 RepID=A0ABD1IPK2_SALDI
MHRTPISAGMAISSALLIDIDNEQWEQVIQMDNNAKFMCNNHGLFERHGNAYSGKTEQQVEALRTSMRL